MRRRLVIGFLTAFVVPLGCAKPVAVTEHPPLPGAELEWKGVSEDLTRALNQCLPPGGDAALGGLSRQEFDLRVGTGGEVDSLATRGQTNPDEELIRCASQKIRAVRFEASGHAHDAVFALDWNEGKTWIEVTRVVEGVLPPPPMDRTRFRDGLLQLNRLTAECRERFYAGSPTESLVFRPVFIVANSGEVERVLFRDGEGGTPESRGCFEDAFSRVRFSANYAVGTRSADLAFVVSARRE